MTAQSAVDKPSADSAFLACEAIVRRHDPDRYFSALFAPAAKRKQLFAVYALNYELARISQSVRDPMMGEIRLQWWRDEIAAAWDHRPGTHDVTRALAAVFGIAHLPQSLFDAMIDARAFDFTHEMFPTTAALEDYARATSGSLMKLAARILGCGETLDAAADEAGIAYALTGILRAIPFHAARGKVFLPEDLLRAVGLSREELLAGQGGEKLKAVVAQLSLKARAHWAEARKARPRRAIAAILPAALVPLYLKCLKRRWFELFRHQAIVAVHRRQFALLAAATRGRL